MRATPPTTTTATAFRSCRSFARGSKAAVSPRPSGLRSYTDSLEAPGFEGPYGGVRTFFGDHTLPLNYSDGDQYTLDDVVPGHAEYQPYLDFDEDDDRLSDDERDADGDGLRNIDESHNAGAFDENDAPEAFRATRPSCS